MMSIEDYQDEIVALLVGKHGFTEQQVLDHMASDSLVSHCFLKGRDTTAVADALAKKWRE